MSTLQLSVPGNTFMDNRCKAEKASAISNTAYLMTRASRCPSISSSASRTASSIASSQRNSSVSRKSSQDSSASPIISTLPSSVVESHFDYDLPCEFAISNCHARFSPSNFEDWVDHSLSHFQDCGPPPKSVCSFCDNVGVFENARDPHSGWQRRLKHIASHYADGQTSSDWRPDYFVIEHMLQNDLLQSDDYAWMMKHAEKPTFEGTLHTRREVQYMIKKRDDRTVKEVHDLEKEGRQMRKEPKRRGRHRALPRMEVFLSQESSTNSRTNLLETTPLLQQQTKPLPASSAFPTLTMNKVLEEFLTSSSTIPRLAGGSETTYLTEEGGSNEDSEDIVYPLLSALRVYWASSQSNLSMTAKDMVLVGQLLRHLDLSFTDQTENMRHCVSSSTSGSRSTGSSTSLEREFAIPRNTKRNRKADDHPSDDEENGESQLKIRSSGSSNKKIPALCFACPYRKYNSQKYSISDWESCALTPFENTSRIKTHLYQKHRIHQCKRCKVVFREEEDLEAHDMADDRCVVVMAEPIKGVTKVIYDQLKARKKSLWWNQGQTEEDKWFNIYKLLLPNADLPASPYFEPIEDSQESIILLRIQEHIGREIPRFVQAALETMRNNDQINEPIMNHIMELLREAQSRAFATYRASDQQPLVQTGFQSQESNLRSLEATIISPLYPLQEARYDLTGNLEQPGPNLNFARLQIGQQRNHRSSSVADSGYLSNIPEPAPPPLADEQHLTSIFLSSSPSPDDRTDVATSSLQMTPQQLLPSHNQSAIFQSQALENFQGLNGVDAHLRFSETQIGNDCSDPLCSWSVQKCPIHASN